MTSDSTHKSPLSRSRELARCPPLTSFRAWGFRVLAPIAHARLVAPNNPETRSPTLPAPGSVLRRPVETSVKSSRTSITFRIPIDDFATVYYKLDRARDLRDRIKSLFRPSRSLRAFVAFHELAARGFAVPEAIACGERRRARFLLQSFLVTKEVEGGTSLDELVASLSRSPHSSTRVELTEVVRLVADLLRRLHASGIYHADLNPANLLVLSSKTERDDAPRIVLLDADRTVFMRSMPSRRRRLKNVAQLNACLRRWASLRERVRFYRVYDPTFRDRSRGDRRAILEEIEAMTWSRWLR